jgi:DNA topoisomerase-1
MTPSTEVIAGRCTATYDDGDVHEYRGDVVMICKPDDTVLVHDAEGYQPVAWLSRADRVAIGDDGLRAWCDDAFLAVSVHDRYGGGRFPTGTAGTPVAPCPDCDETFVRASGRVSCVECDATYGLPGDATVLESTCEDCGRPEIAVERGQRFEVCLDPGCDPLEAAVAAAFDRVWSCPDCGEDLRVRRRGGLLLGCEAYPECEWSRSFPRETFDGECACGLPTVSEGCVNEQCERATPAQA